MTNATLSVITYGFQQIWKRPNRVRSAWNLLLQVNRKLQVSFKSAQVLDRYLDGMGLGHREQARDNIGRGSWEVKKIRIRQGLAAD